MQHIQLKTSKKSLVPVIAASTVGTLIEWYDFYIFGILATIISTKFFPKENATAAFLATLATFAAGLLVRPFGALFFGRLGDLIGRKYTFMITLVLMGGSTFAIGLVPAYDTIGFWAPLTVLILRLLQGLAIGGEFGGAATFVAEHSPPGKRGFWTSWIQMTGGFGLVVSFVVILVTKASLSPANWEAWGWRIPFLASVFLVVVSVIIRRNMAESPLFVKAKSEGKTSTNPLKESFGNKANLKVVLLAIFGLTLGIGVVGYSSTFFVQSFLIKFLFVDYDQVNLLLIIAFSLGAPFYIFFGWLSDYIGRKPLLMLSLLLSIICFRPIYRQIYQTVNLENKIENKPAAVLNVNRQFLSDGDSLITTTTQHFYTGGTICKEEKTQIIAAGKPDKIEIIKNVIINGKDFNALIFYLFLLMVIVTMSAGPAAAFLVEMFPLKIRYTSMSFPYHIGYGIFGGMSPFISTYLIGKAKDAHSTEYFLAGLNYPIVLMTIAFIIGMLYLKENKTGKTGVLSSFTKSDKAKRFLGIIWILLGLAALYLGIFQLGIPKISSGNQDDLIFGIIAMIIITPVVAGGLLLFGKYSLQGEYR
ncbi:MAG: MFS transporter [Ginsengibacter sp.]